MTYWAVSDMALSIFPKFARRSLPNGLVDSICLKCYRTAAITTDEAERQAQEAAHKCDQVYLTDIFYVSDPDTKLD
jgi:hypothetical protein